MLHDWLRPIYHAYRFGEPHLQFYETVPFEQLLGAICQAYLWRLSRQQCFHVNAHLQSRERNLGRLVLHNAVLFRFCHFHVLFQLWYLHVCRGASRKSIQRLLALERAQVLSRVL